MKAGLGHIVLAEGVSYDVYLQECYRTGRVNICTYEGSIKKNCIIDKWSLQLIHFPDIKRGHTVGSLVAYIDRSSRSTRDTPIIIAVISQEDEGQEILPGQFKLFKFFDDTYVQILGDGLAGELFIGVNSQREKPSSISIRATSKNKNSLLQIESDSEIEILSGKQVQVDADSSIVLGSENLEPAVLGNTLAELLNRLLTTLNEAMVETTNGPAPFMATTKERFVQIQDDIDKIKSNLTSLE